MRYAEREVSNEEYKKPNADVSQEIPFHSIPLDNKDGHGMNRSTFY